MKVLFISHDASRTGASLALFQEIKFILSYRRDIHVEILFLKGGEIMDDFKALCPIHIGWPVYSLKNRIKRKIQKERVDYPYLYMFKTGQFDCIYANTVVTFDVAVKLKERLKVPIIGHVHEAECAMIHFRMPKELLSEFSVFIAVSQLTARNLEELYDVDARRIVIQRPVSPWVEKYLNNDIIIEPIEKDDNYILIGLFCNGNWWKSTEIIPLAIKNFQDKYPKNNCKFMIVGIQDERILYRLNYDMKRMGVLDKVIWSGKSDAPLNFHAAFDIFLLLSREESYSLTAQESAIMKTPVVGFEGVSGAAEWINNGAGILVPYMNLDALSDAIFKLSIDVSLRQQMGNKAFEVVSKQCQKDVQITGVLDALNRIVAKSAFT